MMSNSKVGGYVLLVRFRTKDGQQQAFASAMQSAVPATRLEPDNRQYEFYSDQEDPLNFMLYEEYTDEAALQQHRARPEMAKTVAAIQPMLENPPEMSTWTQSLTNARNDDGNRDRVGHVTLVRFAMKPDTVDAVLAEIGGDLDDMAGNIRFDLNRGRDAPLDCMICARWESRAIWEAHNAKPHFKEFAARVSPLLAQSMRRTLWKPAAL
jgi:autoinducer 2-degrading protein